MRERRSLRFPVTALILLAPLACGGATHTEQGADSSEPAVAVCASSTPKETFDNAAELARADDFGGLSLCLPPERRLEIAEAMLKASALRVHFALTLPDDPAQAAEAPAWSERLDAILASFDLPSLELSGGPDPLEPKLKAVVEALDIRDLAALTARLGDFTVETRGPHSTELGELTDVVIEGESARATATTHVEGHGELNYDVVFVRVNGSWYLDESPI